MKRRFSCLGRPLGVVPDDPVVRWSCDAAVHSPYSDPDGAARFEDWVVPLTPEHPAIDELSVSVPLAADAAVFVQAPPGGGHAQQPEARRQLVVILAGECDVTASGETRTGRSGDVMLVEDTTGPGHSSQTRAGFLGLMIALPPETPS